MSPRDARVAMRGASAPGESGASAPGESFARVRIGPLRGLRRREFPAEALALAVAAPPAAAFGRRRVRWCEAGGRRLVVKEFATGLRGALGDRLRGSPARRAWRAGSALRALGIGAPDPLAFLERCRFGLPVASVVVQEDLCPALRGDAPAPGVGPWERMDALVHLVLALHACGIAHGDLTAANLLLVGTPDGLVARVVDLEDLCFPRRLGEAARVRGLAQLNASLPDWIPDAMRRRALERYAAGLPFRAPLRRIASRIARESLARRHHWSGRECRADAAAGVTRSRS